MKTVIVVFTGARIDSLKSIGSMKKYSFNTDADLSVGDMIKSAIYTTTIQVVAVLDKSFKYYNALTGDLSDDYTSTNQWLVRTLVIGKEDADVVYGTIISKGGDK